MVEEKLDQRIQIAIQKEIKKEYVRAVDDYEEVLATDGTLSLHALSLLRLSPADHRKYPKELSPLMVSTQP